MSSFPQISALVVAHNEAEQLSDCLQGLSFANQLVVVLDRCTDASREIALGFGAKIVEGAWPIEGERRQAGQNACDEPWILEVDADERVPLELAQEIQTILCKRESQKDGPAWWRIPFDNYIGSRLVRYGWGAHFGVGAKAVLYRRGTKSWGSQRVHPRVKMHGEAGETLTNRAKHLVDRDVSDMIHRLDRYSTLHALDLIDEGAIGTFRKNALRILGRFYKCFILRKGYREGPVGFAIALFAGLYPFLSFLKALELKNELKT